MRKYIATAAYLVAALCAAPAAVQAQPTDWSGYYGGWHLGYGSSDIDWTFVSDSSTADHRGSGYLGGFFLGRTFQQPGSAFVFGGELDLSGAQYIEGDTACGLYSCESDISLLTSIRGHAGLAFGRALVYATAGGGHGRIRILTDGPGKAGETQNVWGWTAGLGLQYALGPVLSLRGEYLLHNFTSDTFAVSLGDEARVSGQVTSYRLGLAWRY